MKVRITRCENDRLWYRNQVGNQFEGSFEPESGAFLAIDKGWINQSDFEIIEEQTVQNSKEEYDNVNKPFHYHKSGLDPITIMKRTFTKAEYAGFCKGNVLKYNQRYNEKGGAEDLKKALFYQQELIEWEGE